MRQADVPTADFRVFDHPEMARQYIAAREYAMVVKADGLAAGKGVLVCNSTEEALAAFGALLRTAPQSSEAHRNLAIAYASPFISTR